jgi:ABC-type branched-subunit amino acid transport system permease subunit
MKRLPVRDRIASFAAGHAVLVAVVVAAALVALPFVLTSGYHLRVATLVGIYILLVPVSTSSSALPGCSPWGTPRSTASGAYTSAMLTVMAGWSFWLALPVAGIVAGIFGMLIGLVTLRLQKVFSCLYDPRVRRDNPHRHPQLAFFHPRPSRNRRRPDPGALRMAL